MYLPYQYQSVQLALIVFIFLLYNLDDRIGMTQSETLPCICIVSICTWRGSREEKLLIHLYDVSLMEVQSSLVTNLFELLPKSLLAQDSVRFDLGRHPSSEILNGFTTAS